MPTETHKADYVPLTNMLKLLFPLCTNYMIYLKAGNSMPTSREIWLWHILYLYLHRHFSKTTSKY